MGLSPLSSRNNDFAVRNGMKRSEPANAAEWSDERRRHFCIGMPIWDNAVCGFFIAVNINSVSEIGMKAIIELHLECRYASGKVIVEVKSG